MREVIEVEGYKAFRGVMKITPRGNSPMGIVRVVGDWLYKPDTDCWYGRGSSYPAQVCEIVEVWSGECEDK